MAALAQSLAFARANHSDGGMIFANRKKRDSRVGGQSWAARPPLLRRSERSGAVLAVVR